MIGKTISHYKIIEKLGEGGMGVVYKAEDTKLKRTVALKFLPPELTRDPEAKEWFVREAQAASALDHPHIGTIYEIDESEEGQLFMAMACYDGETLKEKIEQWPLRIDEAIELALQVADGLTKAYQQGIIHRDIKPANVMVTPENQVKILDFGLAKSRFAGTQFTRAGTTLGTVAYMSPEQLRGEVVDHRTDIWSLGVLIYEMVTGRLPFRGDYEQAVTYSILNEEPELMTGLRTGVPMDLERIVNKALVKNSSERYQHVEDILVDLRTLRKELESGKTRAAGLTKEKLLEKNRTYLYGGVAILLILLIVGGLSLFTARSEAIDSIAVLPLENLSGDPEQDYFADGMTEALITNLSKIQALKVISRTSAMRYKGTDKPLPEIARELNVDAVVEGTVLRVGDRVRITAQLIEATTDQHLWAESYERDLRDILALQSEVAREIADEIELKLTPGEQARLTTSHTVNPDAHEAYLRGLFHLNEGTTESFLKAIDYFNDATRIDSNYAQAYAKLAESYALFASYQILSPHEAYPKAKVAAAKALQLDESLAESHAAVGVIRLQYDRDWAGAETELRRALELNPSYATAHHFYSWYLCAIGQMEEAVTEFERVLALDPLSRFTNGDFGCVLHVSHYYKRAVEQLLKTLELDPVFDYAHWWLGLAYLKTGESGKALDHLREAVNLSPNAPKIVAALAYGYAVTGERKEAQKTLARLQEMSQTQWVPPYDVAMVYAGLGEEEKALEWLDRALDARDSWLPWVNVQPEFENIRSDPRFRDLLRRMNFPEN